MTIRAAVLARDKGICQECKRSGAINRDSIATIVDHITPLSQGGTDDMINLECQCTAHARAKTAREAAHARGHRVKTAIGEDGWPIG